MLSTLISQLHITDIPILDLGQRVGWTGYIDFIQSADMTHPIMKGVDHYMRPFLAIKVNCNYPSKGKDEENDESSDEEKEKKVRKCQFVYTIFQRYTDTTSCTTGTCYPSGLLFGDCGMITEVQMRAYGCRINKLLSGEQVRAYDMYGFPRDEEMLLEEGNGDLFFTIESVRQPIRDAVYNADVMCRDLASLVVDMF